MELLVVVAAVFFLFVIVRLRDRVSGLDRDLRALSEEVRRLKGLVTAPPEQVPSVTQAPVPATAQAPPVRPGVTPAPAADVPVRPSIREAPLEARPVEAVPAPLPGPPLPSTPAAPVALPSTRTGAPVQRHRGVETRLGGEVQPVSSPSVDDASSWQSGGSLLARLSGENPVARVGGIVLFFGVAFFFKHAIDRGWIPIELRLVAAALGGLALSAAGWRLRTSRRDYGLVLQGIGAGVVYLTIFVAVSLYSLIAPGPGFFLMVLTVAATCTMAVQQDAPSLASLAVAGGFLAPVLMPGGGSHVALFSYFLALNLGIVGVAWYKTWRAFSLLGFIFTFVLALAWGGNYYRAEYFASTEPFLVAFFLLYVAVPILNCRRQAAESIDGVSRSIAFSTPVVAFGLQSALVPQFEYGLAISAACAAVLYGGLWVGLRGRTGEALRMLSEIFLALAVVLATVAVPLAFDGRAVAGIWALEGAALVWWGARQRRPLALGFGALIQITSGLAFLNDAAAPASSMPVLNGAYLTALVICVAGLFSGWILHRDREAPAEPWVSTSLLGWGLLWWFGGGCNEIFEHVVSPVRQLHGCLTFVTLSAPAMAVASRRLAWPQLLVPVPGLLAVMALAALGSFTSGMAHPLANLGWVAWGLAFAGQYWLLRRFEEEWSGWLVPVLHTGTLWLAGTLASWEVAWLLQRVLPASETWRLITWTIVPVVTLVGLPAMRHRPAWPVARYAGAYLATGLVPFVAFLALWVIVTTFLPGEAAPLRYLPLLNPLELAQGLSLAVLLWWSYRDWVDISEASRWYAWAGLGFLALNGAIARATHFLGGVAFSGQALWASTQYQTAVSITWTVAALVVMVVSTRFGRRDAWRVGAMLLGAVVVKLFFVDLAGVDTVARIVSFLVVGLLFLLIGYLAPQPPRSEVQV